MNRFDLTGRTLGQYIVMARLGRGGMADVYKAFHPQLEVYRAIKVIRPEFVTTDDFQARFQKEAQAVAALRHPNIVQVQDFGEIDDIFFMVMEFVQGQDLKQFVQDEGRIRPISRAVGIVSQIADALHYAHSRGLIHRDIKPENIMINQDGLPILMDFGISKLLTVNTQLTRTGLSIGTPAYMAPEQAKAEPEIGPPADIYSLSIVLYEMLTGQLPFSADTPLAAMIKAINDPLPLPRTISADVSESLQQVLVKGTAKDVSNRYATALQFQSAMNRALEDEPDSQQPAATELFVAQDSPAPQTQTPPSGGRRNGPLFALLTTAALLIAAGVYFFMPGQPGTGETARSADQNAQSPDTASTIVDPGKSDDGQAAAAPAPEPKAEPRLSGTAPESSDTPDLTTAPRATNAAPESTAQHAVRTTEPVGSTDTAKQKGVGQVEQSRKLVDERAATQAGQPLEFSLEAATNDVLYLQVFTASATTDFELTAPDGRTEIFKYHTNYGPVTLPQSGRYALSALTRGEKTADIEFALWFVDPPVIDGGVIEPGRYTKGETAVPGQQVAYRFEAESGQTLFFDYTASSNTTDFSIVAPDGRSELFKYHTDQGPLQLKQTGTYTLTADPRSDKTASFEFALWHVDPPVIDGGIIEPGRYTKGETAVPGQQVAYRFEAESGQTLFFDHTASSNTTDFRVVAPDGRSELFKYHTDQGPLQLKQTGTYTLTADPRSDKTASFEFALWHVDPPVIDGGIIEPGRYTKGETAVPGQQVAYRFEAESGQTLFFDHTASSNTTDFRVVAPDGRSELFKYHTDQGPLQLKQTGTYTLTADPRSDKTASFEFALRFEQ